MIIKETTLNGVLLFYPDVHRDNRGYFFESYNERDFNLYTEQNNKYEPIKFVQENVSFSEYGVLRGLHMQKSPMQQGKLVRVLKGKVFDVVVDCRRKSKTYGKHFSILLSASNKISMYIPEGFAHGFLVRSGNGAIFQYKCTNYYSPKDEIGYMWNDKNLNIEWPATPIDISEKDKHNVKFLIYKKYK